MSSTQVKETNGYTMRWDELCGYVIRNRRGDIVFNSNKEHAAKRALLRYADSGRDNPKPAECDVCELELVPCESVRCNRCKMNIELYGDLK